MRLLAISNAISFVAASHQHAGPPQLDGLMLFGFFAAFLTLVVGLYARQSRLGLATFAVCLTATAVYGFMQGAWPIAIVQAAWAAVVFGRSLQAKNIVRLAVPLRRRIYVGESRMSRMFGA
jgi:hypothetical protein